MASELKPCPFCKAELGVELIDNGDGTTYHSARDIQCPLEGMDIPLDLWNNRPGEDVARLKQFEEDCEAVCEYCEAGVVIELFGDVWVHADGISCAASHLRSVWEERHDRKEEHGI